MHENELPIGYGKWQSSLWSLTKGNYQQDWRKKPNWVWCIRCFDHAVSWQTKLLICRVFILVYRKQSQIDGQTLISFCEWASGVCVWDCVRLSTSLLLLLLMRLREYKRWNCFNVVPVLLWKSVSWCPRKSNALFDQRWKKNWRWKNWGVHGCEGTNEMPRKNSKCKWDTTTNISFHFNVFILILYHISLCLSQMELFWALKRSNISRSKSSSSVDATSHFVT